MKILYTVLLLGFFSVTTRAQSIETPVVWSYTAEEIEDGRFSLIFTADIAPGWYLYSQHLEDDGPIPTTISFYESDNYELLGATEEDGPKVEGMDALFGMYIVKYKKQATFTRQIKAGEGLREVSGYIEFMTCDDEKCLPPTEIEFTFSFKE